MIFIGNDTFDIFKKYKKEIDERFLASEKKRRETGKSERMKGTKHDPQRVYQGTISEFIVGHVLASERFIVSMPGDVFCKWDLLLNGRKVDVKGIYVREDRNLDVIKDIQYFNFYLMTDQVRHDVNYCPIWVNFKTGQYIIILSNNNRGKNISEKYVESETKPENTTYSEDSLNYVIPVKDMITN